MQLLQYIMTPKAGLTVFNSAVSAIVVVLLAVLWVRSNSTCDEVVLSQHATGLAPWGENVDWQLDPILELSSDSGKLVLCVKWNDDALRAADLPKGLHANWNFQRYAREGSVWSWPDQMNGAHFWNRRGFGLHPSRVIGHPKSHVSLLSIPIWFALMPFAFILARPILRRHVDSHPSKCSGEA